MNRPFSAFALCGAALALLAPASHAKCFGIQLSDVPSLIVVVGHVDGTPDPYGHFVVIPKTLANQPCFSADVIVDFTDCGDVRVCGDPVSCAYGIRAVRATTDQNGVASFTVMGSSTGSSDAAASTAHCAHVYVDGVNFGSPSVAVLDLDGGAGADANDLSVWLSDFGTGQTRTRGDYDGDGTLGANDVSIWIDVMGAGRSYQSVGTGGAPAPCP